MAAVDDLFAELNPIALTEYKNYVLSRTPPEMQTSMLALVNARAMVVHGANLVVQDNGGGVNAKSPGVLNVTLGVANYARLAA